MRSVADELRREQLEKVQTLSVDERLLLAFDLGETALEMYMGAQGLDLEEAIRRLKRQRQAGRRPSKYMIDIIGCGSWPRWSSAGFSGSQSRLGYL